MLREQELASVAPQIGAEANPDLRALYAELARDPDELIGVLKCASEVSPRLSHHRARSGLGHISRRVPAGERFDSAQECSNWPQS
jgi:hypothetical protein